ncbi:MAG: hypothetical protein JRI23_14150 [Deltaproteobacteria bacterium]|jgi:hypothetical protein|nr:hypothetical protein [Deltaproteobacteria bacterium]MBW2532880.1 hypothetical protein [Deltaproteobacteria bacterium]
MVVARWLSGVAVALSLSSCIPEPAPGEFGTFRYVGNVRGATPLNVIPPISDRDGNAYVLYGELDLLETEMFIGHAAGGWRGGCDITFGNDYGLHGWVGRAQSRAWYWSGEALVRGDGSTGGCRRILSRDPSSGARLNFRAVIPWVLETPSRTMGLAWVQSLTDPVPFQVVLDLQQNVYTNISEFEPRDATDIQVIGVGGNVDEREGVVLVRFTKNDAVYAEARFIDAEGQTSDTESINGLAALPEYGVVGYLQANEGGLYAGLGFDGSGVPYIVLLDRSGGSVVPMANLVTFAPDTLPMGVHEWEGQLWVVGLEGGRPKVWEITDDGDIKAAKTWQASMEAASALNDTISVVDDRTLPSRKTEWSGVRSATGAFPFLHSHRLDHYADGTTTWLVAGPDFQVGGEPWTAIAYAPVGISYP